MALVSGQGTRYANLFLQQVIHDIERKGEVLSDDVHPAAGASQEPADEDNSPGIFTH